MLEIEREEEGQIGVRERERRTEEREGDEFEGHIP